MRWQHTRQKVGPNFSEGARLLWIAMRIQGMNQCGVARVLGRHRGVINRLLYGERRPGLDLALDIQDTFGIRPVDWSRDATQEFITPAAKMAPVAPAPESQPPRVA